MRKPRWTIRGLMLAVALVAAIAYLWRQYPGPAAGFMLFYGTRTLWHLHYRSQWRAEGRERTEADWQAVQYAARMTTFGILLIWLAGILVWRAFR